MSGTFFKLNLGLRSSAAWRAFSARYKYAPHGFGVRWSSRVPPSPDTIMINDRAVQQMQKVCSDGSSLRITVEGGGCSGFQYLFSLEEPDAGQQEEDICIQYKNTQVLVDTDSMEYIKGSTLDYNTELIRSAFRIIDNPKAEAGCSCGASFAAID